MVVVVVVVVVVARLLLHAANASAAFCWQCQCQCQCQCQRRRLLRHSPPLLLLLPLKAHPPPMLLLPLKVRAAMVARVALLLWGLIMPPPSPPPPPPPPPPPLLLLLAPPPPPLLMAALVATAPLDTEVAAATSAAAAAASAASAAAAAAAAAPASVAVQSRCQPRVQQCGPKRAGHVCGTYLGDLVAERSIVRLGHRLALLNRNLSHLLSLLLCRRLRRRLYHRVRSERAAVSARVQSAGQPPRAQREQQSSVQPASSARGVLLKVTLRHVVSGTADAHIRRQRTAWWERECQVAHSQATHSQATAAAAAAAAPLCTERATTQERLRATQARLDGCQSGMCSRAGRGRVPARQQQQPPARRS